MKLLTNQVGNGYRRFRYPTLLIFSGFILSLLLTYLAWPVYGIEISTNHVALKTFIIPCDSEIYIDYTHSVEKTSVRDVFEIGRNHHFLLIRTEYSSFGAGLPTDNFGEFKVVDGIFINSGINQELSNISLRVGRIANHSLVLEDGRHIYLKDYAEGGSLVIIKPVKTTRFQAFFIQKED
ncbi:DUF1850 domain-containing protein [Clostridium formicaceticum]|nr:DUF1850 domain-containing protein [Clostridium formicaceticum]AOY76494.1 hypothetical protein BJL90_11875 [Clostridium formicaceticum]